MIEVMINCIIMQSSRYKVMGTNFYKHGLENTITSFGMGFHFQFDKRRLLRTCITLHY